MSGFLFTFFAATIILAFVSEEGMSTDIHAAAPIEKGGLTCGSKESPPAVESVAVDQAVAGPQDIVGFKQMSKSGGLVEYHLSQALLDLKETGIKGNAMPFPLTIVLNLEMRLRRAEEALEYWRGLCEKERLKVAVLETQLAAERKVKILQNLLLTVGGLLNTLGVKLLFDKQKPSGLAMLGLGIALQIAGWLWPRGGARKQ